MSDKNRPSNAESARAPERASPSKRFRIERLEERIAPKKGGKGTNNCGSSGGSNSGSSGSTSIF